MTSSPRLGVTIVSGHQLVIEELRRFLKKRGFEVHGLRLNAGVSELANLKFPRGRLCVVDGNASAKVVEAIIAALVNARPNIRIIALQEKFTDSTAFPLLRIGTKGLVTYDASRAQLPRALRMIHRGGYWVPRQLLSRFVGVIVKQRNARPVSDLLMSSREREVLAQLRNNLSNKEIASALNISERTAKFHVSNLLAKFGVRRRADLIVLAYQSSELHSRDRSSTFSRAAANQG